MRMKSIAEYKDKVAGRAAIHTYPMAQFHLGLMYANGKGVPKNSPRAVNLFRMAADLGYAEAQFNLGLMYANGRGVTRDEARAVLWFRKAIAQGYTGNKPPKK